ncbi:MAG: chemotaxis protein CheC [Pseudomonadota bacterium]
MLTEIFNIGIGRAANSLSLMAMDEVGLTVPSIKFTTRKKAAGILVTTAGEVVCSVMQRLEGTFNADAILIFPQANSLEIVKLMVGDTTVQDLSELELEALCEIGNIILNACIGTLTNILGGEFNISLPSTKIDTCWAILELERRSHDEVVMLLYIDFIMETRKIHGHLAILQDIVSIPIFAKKIEDYLSTVKH